MHHLSRRMREWEKLLLKLFFLACMGHPLFEALRKSIDQVSGLKTEETRDGFRKDVVLCRRRDHRDSTPIPFGTPSLQDLLLKF